MPQFEPSVFVPQLVWLTIVFVALLLVRKRRVARAPAVALE